MAANTIFIYNKRSGTTSTANDVVVLSNSTGVYDAGQYQLSNVRSASNTFALMLSASDAKLTVGGDYHGETGSDQYNIFVSSTITSPVVASDYFPQTLGAVQFKSNGTLVLASQAGNVHADQDVYDSSALKNDANMKISASRVFATSSDAWETTTYGALPTMANVNTIQAAGKLTVNGSVVGAISASNDVDLEGGKTTTASGVTLVDNVSSQQLNSIVFKAGTIEIGNNVEGSLSATNTGTLKSVNSPSITGNALTAAIFEADDFELANGLWAGSASVKVSDVLMENLEYENAGDTPVSTNNVTAKVLNAPTVNINEIGSAAGLAAGKLTASLSNVSLLNEQIVDSQTVRAAAMNSNVIEAVTIDGTTVNIAKLNQDADLQAAVSGVTLKESGYTASMTGNTASAIGIRGTSVTIGDYFGSISTSLTGIQTSVKSGTPKTVTGNTTRAAGIYASSLHVAGMMEGTITVSADSVINRDSYNTHSVAGIEAVNGLTVDGRIDTDITVNSGLVATFGIAVGTVSNNVISGATLTADAFTGSINAAKVSIGIAVGTFATTVSGDSFDVAGSITAGGIGVDTSGKMNLRVSGSINAATAIAAGRNEDQVRNDTVELAATARVTGNINLYKGDNTLIMNSNAQLNGSMLASEGVLNVRFVLDGAQTGGRAVVKGAGASDFTLNSGSTIAIDLNYAKNGETYKLIEYGLDADQYWYGSNAEHVISFSYHGQIVTATINKANQKLDVEIDGATASLFYDTATDTVIVNNVAGVTQREKFASVTGTSYDAEKRTATITWDNTNRYGYQAITGYELEYTVYRGTEKCGESIAVQFDGTASSYTIRNLDTDQRVECRMRLIGSGYSPDPTAWSDSFAIDNTTPAAANTPSFTGKETKAVNTVDAAQTLQTAAATVSWESPATSRPMDHYVVEVFETNDQILMSDAEKQSGMSYQTKIGLEMEAASQAGLVYSKTVTNNETVVSGLQHLAYIYWRVKGVDVDGNETEWIDAQGNKFAWLPGTVKDVDAPKFALVEGRETSSVAYDMAYAPDMHSATYTLTFNWNKALDATTGIRSYSVEYTRVADTEWANATVITVDALNAELTDPEYLYTLKVEDVACGAYMYRIKATDYLYNDSAYIGNEAFGDGDAPTFITIPGRESASVICLEDRSQVGKVYFDTMFMWDYATDGDGTGVRNYVIEYTLASDTEWANSTCITVYTDDPKLTEYRDQLAYVLEHMEGGEYQYRIKAVDYAENASEYIGNETFGTTDVEPPQGAFTSFEVPVISVEYGEINVVNEAGNTESQTVIKSASVAFAWDDTYTDDSGVRYRVQFSDSDTFSSSKTYAYETTTVGQKSYTITTLPTEPVGIFATMSTVYWRVMAIDDLGNETGIYSQTQAFKFVDSEGNKIKHLSAPDKPYNMGVELTALDGVNTGDIEISWDNNHTDLGILSYDLKFSSQDGGDNFTWTVTTIPAPEGGEGTSSHISGPLVNVTTGDNLKDGTYTWTITARNAAGTGTKSDKYKFVVDTVRPTTVTGLNAQTLTSDVILSWNASSDHFGVANYEVNYRTQGTEAWNTVTTLDTSYSIYGIHDGNYEFQVTAYDVNGNSSLASEVKTFTVNSNDDLCDVYNPLLWESYEEAAGPNGIEQSIGTTDVADYFYIVRDTAFSLTVNIEEFAMLLGKKSNATVAFYRYDGSGKEKAIKSISVSKAKDGIISNKLLDAGVYYFKITSKKADSKEQYTLSLATDDFVKANQEADDSAAAADQIASRAENPTYLSMTKSVTNEWVGYSDLKDYRKIELDYSGSYDFTLTGLNSGASVALTVWKDKGNGKLSKVKSVSVKGKTQAAIADLLLDDANSYYVSVEAKNGKKGQNSDYNLFMSGEEFTKGNNADDDYQTMDKIYKLAAGGEVTGEWVGYGDLKDYRSLDFAESGSYDFTLSNLDGEKVQLTVWEVKSNGKLSSVKKLSVSGKSEAVLSGVNLDAEKSYVVSMEAKNGSKGKNSDYDLAMSGTWVPEANHADDLWAQVANAASPFEASSTVRDWVGKGDLVDWFKLEIDEAGTYDLALNLGVKADVALYQVNGSSMTEITGLQAELSAGIYALKVNAILSDVSYKLEFDKEDTLIKAKLA